MPEPRGRWGPAPLFAVVVSVPPDTRSSAPVALFVLAHMAAALEEQRTVAQIVWEDDDLTMLMLGHCSVKAFLCACAMCKRLQALDVKRLWQQFVLRRWPASKDLQANDFKSLYITWDRAEREASSKKSLHSLQFVIDIRLRRMPCVPRTSTCLE